MKISANLENILKTLPEVNGSYKITALSKLTWFRVGGDAIVFTPFDKNDLQYFLKNKPIDLEIHPLGLGSNILARDGGINGVVIRMTAFSDISVHGTTVNVGAGVNDLKVAKIARDNFITGLEFMSGIPGCIGGALAMNAGAYGTELKDVLISATALDMQGNALNLTNSDMGFSYRHCNYAGKVIFLSAIIQGSIGNIDEILKIMNNIQTSRSDSQPIKQRTGGSTFSNPDGHKAWKLIDDADLRGKEIGGAKISEQHCNFLINTGNASASDLELLGKLAKDSVKINSNVDLHWEIKRIGYDNE